MATLRGDIKQRDLEAFEADYNPRIRNDKGELDLNGQQRFYGASVRAAVASGWFTDLTTQEQVDADGVLPGRRLDDRPVVVGRELGVRHHRLLAGPVRSRAAFGPAGGNACVTRTARPAVRSWGRGLRRRHRPQ